MANKLSTDRLKEIAEEAKKLSFGTDCGDRIVSTIYSKAEEITSKYAKKQMDKKLREMDQKIDNILTSKWLSIPIMLLLLGVVFWITLVGANYPSTLLADVLFWVEGKLTVLIFGLEAPSWVHGILVKGMYRCLAWVVSVMLPPMAIFFPLFTLMEDLGYLPRVAFNLDYFFKKAGAHGKQALTMCMGFGCNAAGVIACRIIQSPRERLVAMLTNNFVPCNGRFPTLITLASIFFGGLVVSEAGGIKAAFMVVLLVVLGIGITLMVSWILSKTLLKGIPSSFILELPPYRKPLVGQILIRSLIDRTLFVLSRAVVIAAPAGAIIWILANTMIGKQSIIVVLSRWLDPLANSIGLDGVILLAFILGLPANEIVLPIMIMTYLSAATMIELDSLEALQKLLIMEGWTWGTALCTMLFSLLHFPCGTTLLTIRKETKSIKWLVLAVIITTATAVTVCFVMNQLIHLLGLL